MKITATIKDKADAFYHQLDAMLPREAWSYLNKEAFGLYAMDGLSIKIGSGQFRDKVELNQLFRSDKVMTYKREARRGYFLITFNIGD